MTNRTYPSLLLFLILLSVPDYGSAAPPAVARKVKEGIAAYEAGNYRAAAEAFAEAEDQLPGDPRIVLDRAVALAAAGENEEAEALFQEAAQASEPTLAARAHYNLGCLAAGRCRSILGPRPKEAPPTARQRALEFLEESAGHYRDCLRLNENDADARYNLEAIRLWAGRIRSLGRDREQQESASQAGTSRKDPSQAAPRKEPDINEPGIPSKRPGAGADQRTADKEGGGAAPDEERTRPADGRETPRLPQDAIEQRAEAFMDKLRERQQERRQWEKRVQLYLNRPEKPDKDW
jgi:tetratricopeptide (TPR) repeat protein